MKHLMWTAVFMFWVSHALAEPTAGTILKEPKTGMEFVWVPSGCFNMGSNDGERFEKPIHQVCVRGYWLGKYEVTQAQYATLLGTNPSDFSNLANPVDQVSWDDAKKFAEVMSYVTGVPMRLPSEAEWEYACRAGGQHQLYCGDGDPTTLAWYGINSNNETHPVGTRLSNAWGLHDMSGNVWEWLDDCWNISYQGAPTDGSAWRTGNCFKRVARGGAWDIEQPNLIRAAKRGRGDHHYRLNIVGIRLAIGPKK